MVTSFLIAFGDKVTKILRNNLFTFHFVLHILPCKWKTWYRKSCNLSDEKTKNEVTKYVMSQALWIKTKIKVPVYIPSPAIRGLCLSGICFWAGPVWVAGPVHKKNWGWFFHVLGVKIF